MRHSLAEFDGCCLYNNSCVSIIFFVEKEYNMIVVHECWTKESFPFKNMEAVSSKMMPPDSRLEADRVWCFIMLRLPLHVA